MREILFRGKSVEKADTKDGKRGEWIFGGIAITHRSIPETVWITADEDNWYDGPLPTDYEVDPKTVGQYTGMRDKNGREIYEGDIVKYASWIFEPEGTLPVGVGNGKVYFKYGCFCVTGAQYEDECALIDCEVIGNIHDNPELFEENV